MNPDPFDSTASTEPATETESVGGSSFPNTQWTRVIEVIQGSASDAAWAALSEFCLCYRPVVYHFFCRHGCDHQKAEDYTQDFFVSRVLKRWDDREGFLHTAQRSRGTFRSFLSHVLWLFLKDQWKAQRTARSGGTFQHIPFEALAPTDECADEEAFKKFGIEFDREFARQIIQRAAQKSKHSKHLLAHLRGEISQAQAADELGLSENTFRQAYHRFRQRFASDLADEVAKLAGPEEKDVRDEIRYLMSLFG